MRSNSRHVAGAAFDVFVEEPATANVLFGHPNVICTPHLGASTTEAQENVALQVAEQMSDYLLTRRDLQRGQLPVDHRGRSAEAEAVHRAGRKARLVRRPAHRDAASPRCRSPMRAHVAEMKIKALTSAALSGLLRPMLGDVNVVSAPVVAKERGMVVDEIVRAAQSDYESLITVTVTTERQERSVSGTVYADGKPRLVDIKGIRVDAEFGKSMIYVTNEDKPGFIGRFAGLLGDAKINIATFHLGRNKQGGDAIALVEVDGAVPADVLAKVQALPQVKQAKALVFRTRVWASFSFSHKGRREGTPIPSPRRSSTRRNTRRRTNRGSPPAASRAARPPSARPIDRRRRRPARSGSRPARSCSRVIWMKASA